MLSCNHLSFSYLKEKPVLKDISFQLEKGKISILLGKNGCGKSTLMQCLSSLLKAKDGELLLENISLFSLKSKERGKYISYLPQKNNASSLSVFDSMLLGRLPYISFKAKKEDYEITQSVINRLKLNEIAFEREDSLSIGMQQFISLGRAFVTGSKVLLLDEPTSALDISRQVETFHLLKEESKEKIILLSMHDIHLAMEFGEHFLLMKDGEILFSGGEEVITEDNLSLIYDYPVKIDVLNGKKHIYYQGDTNEKSIIINS